MLDLEYDLKQMQERDHAGSHATRANRARILSQMARELKDIGYKDFKRADQLKGRHVNALIAAWKGRELSAGTMKNRMSAVRWWAEKTGRPHVVPSDNARAGIDNRSFVPTDNKARDLPVTVATMKNEHVRASLQLQAAFGLRREEAIKFRPSEAVKGDQLHLRGSWTKGGKPREIPIRNEVQRQALAEAARVASKGSLIPENLKYVQQMKIYERECNRAGLDRAHGLRHQYAQTRYRELTDREAPIAGGKSRRELTPVEREQDREARLVISRELGHEREQITTAYLGR